MNFVGRSVADGVSFNTAVNVWVSIQSVGLTDTL